MNDDYTGDVRYANDHETRVMLTADRIATGISYLLGFLVGKGVSRERVLSINQGASRKQRRAYNAQMKRMLRKARR